MHAWTITVVPLLRDHKKSPQKWSLKRGMPYLVGNQHPSFEVTFGVLSKEGISMAF